MMALLPADTRIAVQHDPLLQQLPAETLSMVFEAFPVGERSEHDLGVANRLVDAGLNDDEITQVFANRPCGQKARENGFGQYLSRTLNKARSNGHHYLPRKKKIPSNSSELVRRIGEIRGESKKAQTCYEAVARLVVEYFDSSAKFFSDGESKAFLCYQGQTVELSGNRQFRSLLQAEAGLSLVNKDGQLALDRLANHATRHGQVVTTRGPVHCDRRKHRIYFHNGQQDGQIVRISPNKVELVGNGTNEDRVCLVSPEEFRPFKLHQDVDVLQALELYQSKLIDQLACSDVDRLTIHLWLLNVLLLDYSSSKIVMKFSGPQSSGKTVASRLIGLLFAGQDILQTRTTGPALYADPMPIKILDNVENRDFRKAYEDHVIFAATGGSRSKMKHNSDTERIRHPVNCLLLLNGIESLERSEILSRIYELEFHTKYQVNKFLEATAMDNLLESRDIIMSGLIRMLANHVLPRIVADGIVEWKQHLDESYSKHPKRRSFEFLARMGIIAEAVQRCMNPDLTEQAILKAARSQLDQILQRQESSAVEANVETNVLANHIHGLAQEASHWDSTKGTFISHYHLKIEHANGEAKFRATARELLNALSAISKKLGLRGLELKNPRSLSARLASESQILKTCGIEVEAVDKQNNTNVYEVVVKQ